MTEIPKGWKDTFSKEENKGGVMGSSSFAVLFPKYREAYIKQCWKLVESSVLKHVSISTDSCRFSRQVMSWRDLKNEIAHVS